MRKGWIWCRQVGRVSQTGTRHWLGRLGGLGAGACYRKCAEIRSKRGHDVSPDLRVCAPCNCGRSARQSGGGDRGRGVDLADCGVMDGTGRWGCGVGDGNGLDGVGFWGVVGGSTGFDRAGCWGWSVLGSGGVVVLKAGAAGAVVGVVEEVGFAAGLASGQLVGVEFSREVSGCMEDLDDLVLVGIHGGTDAV